MKKINTRLIFAVLVIAMLLTACTSAPADEPEATTDALEPVEEETVPPELADLIAGSGINMDDLDESEEDESDEPAEKTVLTMALCDDPNFVRISSVIQKFNSQSNKYRVVIKDYSDGGEYDIETAQMKLNVDIGSGNCPDMICFWGMSPTTFISHGYLMDMLTFIDEEENVSREDISILKALTQEGGLYLLSDFFYVNTGCGLYSTFGDRYGWTLDEYLEIESSRLSGSETIYNMTHESYLEWVVSRYANDCIDWSSGVCNLDKDTFIALLEAGARIRETPEPTDPNLMNFTPTATRLAEGSLVMGMVDCRDASTLAYQEKLAGEKLSLIGWPTLDGSNGSSIGMQLPIGMYSYTENPDGCWEFIKFMLTKNSTGYGSLSIYKPNLLDAVDTLKHEKIKHNFVQEGMTITDEDAERFLAFIEDLDHMEMKDDAVMTIVTEEAMAYFDGKQTAERAAELIQSRVQIYVSEQS